MHLYFITLFKAVNTSISAVRVIMWHKSHTYPCISNRSTCFRKCFKEVLFIPLYCEALIPERQFPNPPKENPAVSTKENSWKILCVTESSLQFLLSYSVHSISLNQKNCLFFFFFCAPAISFQLWLKSGVAWGEILQSHCLFTHWGAVRRLPERSQTHCVMSWCQISVWKGRRLYLLEPWPVIILQLTCT